MTPAGSSVVVSRTLHAPAVGHRLQKARTARLTPVRGAPSLWMTEGVMLERFLRGNKKREGGWTRGGTLRRRLCHHASSVIKRKSQAGTPFRSPHFAPSSASSLLLD
jgi:hypothetical protein